MIEVYRGSVNAWECDGNGHLNVRFFMEKVWDGFARLCAHAGIGAPFADTMPSTLVARDVHIRFLKELRGGAGLSIHAGVLSIDADRASLLFEVRHVDGTPAATYVIDVRHETAHSGAIALGPATRAALEDLIMPLPAHAAPRSIDMNISPHDGVNRARAAELGVRVTGAYVVRPDHCDAYGRLLPEHFIGRLSDSMAHVRFRGATPASAPNSAPASAEEPAGERRTGGAALEYRLSIRRMPAPGDLIEVRSSIVDVAEKTRRMRHWLLDPASGHAWASAEVVAVAIDMTTRKALSISSAERDAIMASAIPAMTI